MFSRKRDKSKDREDSGNQSNILKDVADRVTELSAQVNELEISDNNAIVSEDVVSDTPRYRDPSPSPTSVHTTPRSRSRERDKTFNREFIDIQNIIKSIQQDPQFSSTITDGLGRIILELQCQLNEICKKIGLASIKNTDEICHDYSSYLFDQENRSDKKFTNNIDDVRNELKNQIVSAIQLHHKQKLNKITHNAAETIFPPIYFSPVDVIPGNDRKSENVHRYFPFRQKFRGKGSEPSITEWLRNLNDAQESCNVSEKEFMHLMRKCATGTVYEELCAMLESKTKLPQIYQALLMKYDSRKRPEVAKQHLENYIPPSDATLKSIQGDIMDLGLRSKLLYAKSAQEMAYNHDTIKALIKAIPEANHSDAYRVLDELNAEYEEYPDYSDFCTALSRYEVTINNNLKKKFFSKNLRPDYSKTPVTYNNNYKRQNAMKSMGRVKNIDARPLVVYENHANRKDYQNRQNSNSNGSNYKSNSNNNISYNKDNNFRSGNNRNNDRNQNNYNKSNYSGNSNREPLGIRGRHSCTLCGGVTHQASGGCFKMRNDQGRLVFCAPSQASCPRCEAETNKILFHPSIYCPRRPKMLQLLSEGKFKYPTPEERQQFRNFIEKGGQNI